MTRRQIGLIVAGIGAVILVLSLAADAVGLSGQGSEGIGNRQILGIVVGAVLAAVGASLAFLPTRPETPGWVCAECGRELREGARACGFCGTPV